MLCNNKQKEKRGKQNTLHLRPYYITEVITVHPL